MPLVYKYYSPTDYNFDALEKGYWYFSRVKKLNDPFDCSFKLVESFSRFIEHSEFKGIIDQVASKMGQYATCSFSKCCNSKLMWASYAQNYQGFCLIFNLESLTPYKRINWEKEEAVITELHNTGYLNSYDWIYSGDVFYTEKLFDLDDDCAEAFKIPITDGEKKVGEKKVPVGGCRIDNKKMDSLFMRLCFTKDRSWEYEQEFRLFMGNYEDAIKSIRIEYDLDKNLKILFKRHWLEGIIVGHNMSVCDRQKLYRILSNYYNVSVYETNPGKAWDIDIVPMDREKLKCDFVLSNCYVCNK